MLEFVKIRPYKPPGKFYNAAAGEEDKGSVRQLLPSQMKLFSGELHGKSPWVRALIPYPTWVCNFCFVDKVGLSSHKRAWPQFPWEPPHQPLPPRILGMT